MATIQNERLTTALMNITHSADPLSQDAKFIVAYVNDLEAALLALSNSIIESDMPVDKTSKKIDAIIEDIRVRSESNMHVYTTRQITDSTNESGVVVGAGTVVEVIEIDPETGSAIVQHEDLQFSLYCYEYQFPS